MPNECLNRRSLIGKSVDVCVLEMEQNRKLNFAGKQRFLLGVVASLCLLTAPVHADFQPIAGFDQQLFPSYLIATAAMRPNPTPDAYRLGDSLSLLGVEVKAPAKDVEVKVAIECDDFCEKSTFAGKLAEANATYRITPKIKFRYDRLARCNQAAPTTVTFRVQLGNGPEEEQVVTCTMRSINDCPFAFRKGDEVVDASFAFAAYVNEQHPFVDKLLREALDIGVVNRFTGYQTGKPEDVLLQAYALWDLLVARDVRYSSITTTAAVSDTVYSQHVRLIEESINNSQANCVDGSTLWVSLMRKIGINAFLVVTPDHCYAGFFADRDRKLCFAIETTLLGEAVDGDELEIPEFLDAAIPEDLRDEDSFASFVASLELGTGRLAKKTETDGAGTPAERLIVDIGEMRKEGVLPIAFQNKEKFEWLSLADVDDDSDDEAEMEAPSEGDDSDSEDTDSSEDDDTDSDDEDESMNR
ncbi:MAG: hypothetical protein U1D30_06575 [Planctomycetota bacterium]